MVFYYVSLPCSAVHFLLNKYEWLSKKIARYGGSGILGQKNGENWTAVKKGANNGHDATRPSLIRRLQFNYH